MIESTKLPADRMPEAEVSLLLAEYLLALPGAAQFASVAIDGASVTVHGKEVFPLASFLATRGWELEMPFAKTNGWTGIYTRKVHKLEIHSKSGVGDVVIHWRGVRIIAECKKGPLTKKRGSPERPLLASALGQALLCNAAESDIVIAAVPDTDAFRKLAAEWRTRPLIKCSGIHICLVPRSGDVSGFPRPGDVK